VLSLTLKNNVTFKSAPRVYFCPSAGPAGPQLHCTALHCTALHCTLLAYSSGALVWKAVRKWPGCVGSLCWYVVLVDGSPVVLECVVGCCGGSWCCKVVLEAGVGR
jgi:hypothetical protein